MKQSTGCVVEWLSGSVGKWVEEKFEDNKQTERNKKMQEFMGSCIFQIHLCFETILFS